MGIIFYKQPKKISLKSNTKIKDNFFITANFWGGLSKKPTEKIHFLGVKYGAKIINIEHHLEMLKRTLIFSKKLSNRGLFLYTNNAINTKFNGMIKIFAFRAGDLPFCEKWSNGTFTKQKVSFQFIEAKRLVSIVLLNPQKSVFLIKEANKFGLPIISFSDINYRESTYSIICNNYNGDSLLYSLLILSNTVLKSRFLVKNYTITI